MRVVHVVHNYWPVVSGIEGVVKALAEGMTKRGHEVHVVTSTYKVGRRPSLRLKDGKGLLLIDLSMLSIQTPSLILSKSTTSSLN
ncbi:MAG: hypothetical protein ACP5U0_03280 [Caldisphaera sp.]